MQNATIKLLEGNVGEHLDDLEFDHDFLVTIPKAWSIKEKISKLGQRRNRKGY